MLQRVVLLVGAAGIAWPTAFGVSTVPPEGEPVEFGSWTGVRHRIPLDPDWLAADDENVYVQTAEYVHVLDPATGSITTSVDNASELCQGIGAGLGAVWTCSGGDVIPIDPESGTAGTPIAINKSDQQGHLATGFDRLWVLIGDGSTLAGVNPASGDVATEIALDARCFDVKVDTQSIWVTCPLDDVVLRIDPDTATIVDRLDVTEPIDIAFTDGAVWIGAASSVVRLDADSLDVVDTIEGGIGRAGSIAADDAGVWVRRRSAPLRRIDPATNEITDELDLGVESGGDTIVAHGAVWTTAFDDAALFRIDLDASE